VLELFIFSIQRLLPTPTLRAPLPEPPDELLELLELDEPELLLELDDELLALLPTSIHCAFVPLPPRLAEHE
jgi:hypothetical protein